MSDNVTIPGVETAGVMKRIVPSSRTSAVTETADSDGDGVGDNADVFPQNAFETLDSDGDGVGDNSDEFPNDATETKDTDSDGVGDNADMFPNNAFEQFDSPVPSPTLPPFSMVLTCQFDEDGFSVAYFNFQPVQDR